MTILAQQDTGICTMRFDFVLLMDSNLGVHREGALCCSWIAGFGVRFLCCSWMRCSNAAVQGQRFSKKSVKQTGDPYEFRSNHTPCWGVWNLNFCFQFRNSANFCRKIIGKNYGFLPKKIGIGISDFGVPVHYVRRT